MNISDEQRMLAYKLWCIKNAEMNLQEAEFILREHHTENAVLAQSVRRKALAEVEPELRRVPETESGSGEVAAVEKQEAV